MNGQYSGGISICKIYINYIQHYFFKVLYVFMLYWTHRCVNTIYLFVLTHNHPVVGSATGWISADIQFYAPLFISALCNTAATSSFAIYMKTYVSLLHYTIQLEFIIVSACLVRVGFLIIREPFRFRSFLEYACSLHTCHARNINEPSFAFLWRYDI